MKALYIGAIFFSAALGAQNTLQTANNANATKTNDICLCCEKDGKTAMKVAKPILLLDGKALSSDYINNINPNSIESINIFKGKNALEKFGIGEKEGVIDIKLKPGATILTYQQLMEKYSLNPTLQLVANKQLLKERQNFVIDSSLIMSVQTLSEPPFVEPAIPHLPGEKIVYITFVKK